MIYAIVLVLLFIFIGLYVRNIMRLTKLKSFYTRRFRQKGYKVYQFPTEIASYPSLMTVIKDSEMGNPLKTFRQVYSENDVIINNFLKTPQICLCSPKLIQQFAQCEQDFCYQKEQKFIQNLLRAVGEGLAFTEKDVWKKKRKIMSKILSYQLLMDREQQIIQFCEQMIDKMEKKYYNQGTITYNVKQFSSHFTSNVIVKLFMGGDAYKQEIQGVHVAKFLIQLIDDVSIQANSPMAFLLGVSFLRLGIRAGDRDINRRIRLFQQWGKKKITLKMQQAKMKFSNQNVKDPETIIQALMLNKKLNPSEPEYTQNNILVELKNFLLGGTDTTAHHIQMVIGYLCQNQSVQQTLRQQLTTHLKQKQFSYKNIKELPYLEAVHKQTLRMYGPINFNFSRRAIKDHLINDIPIYCGTLVKYNSIGFHYSSQFYKNPQQFRPQRWINGQCSNMDPSGLLPFGIGSRSCIGKQLAQMEIKIAISKFVLRYPKINMMEGDKLNVKWKFFHVPNDFTVKFEKKLPKRQ